MVSMTTNAKSLHSKSKSVFSSESTPHSSVCSRRSGSNRYKGKGKRPPLMVGRKRSSQASKEGNISKRPKEETKADSGSILDKIRQIQMQYQAKLHMANS